MPDNQLPTLIRTLWIVIFIIFLGIGGWKYLEAQTPSFTYFIPSAFIGGSLFISLWLLQLLDIFTQYDITTWVAITVIVLSIYVFYLGFDEKDQLRSCGLLGFGGSLFSFGTGISLSRIAQKRNDPNTT